MILPNIHAAETSPWFKILTQATQATLAAIPPRLLRRLSPSRRYTLSVSLVSQTKIGELNRRFRHKNKPTDVLSFPQLVKGMDLFDQHIGDIMICTAIARQQAKTRGVLVEAEMAELAIHGVLHLFGFDHEKRSKARVMFSLQEKIMRSLSNCLNRIESGGRTRGNNRRKPNTNRRNHKNDKRR